MTSFVTRDSAWRCEHDDCNTAVFKRKMLQIGVPGAHHVLQIRAMMASDEWESKGQDAVLSALGAAA